MSFIQKNYSNIAPLQLIRKTQILVEKLSSNRFFPNATHRIARLAAQKDILDNCIKKSGFGDKKAIAQSDKAYAKLLEMLSDLASYVEKASMGNPEILITSGFDILDDEKPTFGTTPYLHPLQLEHTLSEESIQLFWNPIEGNHVYVVQMTTQNVNSAEPTWITVSVCSKSSVEITNLEKGITYNFRIKMVGSELESPYSKVATVYAA